MQAWDDFLKKQDDKLGKETIDKWLRSLKVVHFDSANLYLEAENNFHLSWFEEHIRPLLKHHFSNNNHRPIKVHVSVGQEVSPSTASSKKERVKTPFIFTPDALNPHYTLENFIPGQANRVNFEVLCQLTGYNQAPILKLATYNPIYIWGAPGSGKTHLLMAITAALSKRGIKALYAKTETFTEHVVSAIRASDMLPFRTTYRYADVLLIDDIHLLARKDATQEEFFHTFNALHTSNRQIILTSQHPPSLLEEIEPRLVSRFEWGISLHLEKLQPDDLREVLNRKCDVLDFPLSDSTRTFLLQTFPQMQTLHRALEALILRLHLQSLGKPDQLDQHQAADLLKDLVQQEQSHALSPQKIIHAVATYYGIRKEDILGKSQTQECVTPRQLAMYLCRTVLKLPFMAIGRIFSRDHSTVMTSVKAIQHELSIQNRNISTALFEIARTYDNHL